MSHTLNVQLLLRMKNGQLSRSTLCDAAFTVVLRQEIFVANLLQRPFEPFTEHCGFDTSLTPASDATWTFRVLARAGDISNYAYGHGEKTKDAWEMHLHYITEWNRLKPLTFCPTIHHKEPGQSFPTIWFINHFQLAAFQYYKLCDLLLMLLDPHVPIAGLDRAEKRDARLRDVVRSICGAAISNPKWFPAKLLAGLAIAICGDLFRDASEQAQLLDILEESEGHLGWPCLKVATRLRALWISS
jgi:hypothetical protein